MVVSDGQIVKAAGYGVADRRTGAAAAPETVYKIGSLSKTLVASAVMILVRDGRVGLDDSVGKYITDVPATWRAMTIRHLLSHTSGLPRHGPGLDRRIRQDDAELLRKGYGAVLLSAPGEKWEYSNLGYIARLPSCSSCPSWFLP